MTAPSSIFWFLATVLAISTFNGVEAREGPGFDCAKARQPLAQIICHDDELALIDLRLNQAYDAYRRSLTPEAKRNLDKDQVAFIRNVVTTCRLPQELEPGDAAEATDELDRQRRCIGKSYTGRTEILNTWARKAGGGFDTAVISPPKPNQPQVQPTPDKVARIEVPTVATKDDQILVPGAINGRPVTFMVDSGATSVGIPFLIAKKLNLGPVLDFVTVSFADGRTAVHSVYQIETLRIGDAEVRNVRATVGGDGDSILLGRAALNKFAGWAVDTRNGVLVLFPNAPGAAPPTASPARSVPVARANELPTRIGQCVRTNISAIGSRFNETLRPPTGPLDTSGTSISYSNNGHQVSYDYVPAIAQSRVGDEVVLCLVSVPENCPPGDERGKEYSATNLRTGAKWTLPDAQHSCGGA